MRAVLYVVVAALFAQALAHSYLTNPISRSNQRQSTSGCRGPACLGPCDIPLGQATRAPIPAQRGSPISAQWPRNNHAGGFIRFAWAPTSQSDNAAVFDAGTQQINCHEVGLCHPDDPSNPNGGDSGPSDGSSRPCMMNITIPTSLTDGTWTLQWAWFGGAFALGDYYSCVDYVISGGPSGAPTPAVYVGGDYTYPGQNKCKFFNTDRLHECVNEPCSNPIYPASQEESGPAYMASYANSSSTPAPPPSTPAAPATTGKPAPVTTKAPAAVTSGKAAPATTGKAAAPATTGKQAPSTTGKPKKHQTTGTPAPVPSAPATTAAVPTPTPPATTAAVPTPTPPATTAAVPTQTPPASSACQLGYMMCSGESTYQTCSWASQTETGWSQNQNCPTGLSCHPSGNYIYCY